MPDLRDGESVEIKGSARLGEDHSDQAAEKPDSTDDGFDEDDDFGFYDSFEQNEPSGRYLWLRAEECGNPERAAEFV